MPKPSRALALSRVAAGDADLDDGGDAWWTSDWEPAPKKRLRGNQSQPWNEWDSAWYLAHNYEELRYDDRQLMEWMADFFAGARMRGRGHGIDVGTGTNIYPSLAMLPLCDKITMVERTVANVNWLQSEVQDYAETWDPFWGTFLDRNPSLYKEITNPRERLESVVDVERGNIFELRRDTYDIGTMFFVAESITPYRVEFERGLRRFLASLRRYAPFAAAFMKNSDGYEVGDHKYAAVRVNEEQITKFLEPLAHGIKVRTIPTGSNPLRNGYDGLILATGYAGRARRK